MQHSNNITPYIKPVNILLDSIVLCGLGWYNFSGLVANYQHFLLYQVITWSLVAYFSQYYEIYRFTGLKQFVYKVAVQFVLYVTGILAFFIFIKSAQFSPAATALYTAGLLACSVLLKSASLIYYKSLPVAPVTGSIIIGNAALLPHKLQAGLSASFTQTPLQDIVAEAVDYAQKNNIQTIFCSLAHITPAQSERLITYAAAQGVAVKFVPDTVKDWPKNLHIDCYEDFPLLRAEKTPLHNPVYKFFKRAFDIVFSVFVLVFVLSWLVPLLALCIKLESKGPVFFKQSRPGMEEKEFFCLKFRSMSVNRTSEKMATKNDARVTTVGKFIRKTSLDEMPQFINVLMGDMSIIGPRPQLWGQNDSFKQYINKYSDRLMVKPGITGLAQVKGNRGEITSDAEIQNRVRYDVFYIENWSILLDIRIIIQTVVNIFMGEEKAY